jgi:hypothetical protein
MTRGWTSYDLDTVTDDDTLWTVTEAAHHLGPLPGDPEDTSALTTVAKLRDLTRLHRFAIAGKRRSSRPGHPGRYARVYRASAFIALYELLDADNDENPPAAA